MEKYKNDELSPHENNNCCIESPAVCKGTEHWICFLSDINEEQQKKIQ